MQFKAQAPFQENSVKPMFGSHFPLEINFSLVNIKPSLLLIHNAFGLFSLDYTVVSDSMCCLQKAAFLALSERARPAWILAIATILIRFNRVVCQRSDS